MDFFVAFGQFMLGMGIFFAGVGVLWFVSIYQKTKSNE